MGYEKLKRPLRVPAANLGAAEIRTAQLSLTPAQVKALRATPQALVAAPGEGYALQLLGGTVIEQTMTGVYQLTLHKDG